MAFEVGGNPKLTDVGVDQAVTADQAGGNMEGKEVRFGPAALRACSPRRPPARRPARSTARTTASRRSAARSRWST